MNICITPNSIKLFSAYFKKTIPAFYNTEITSKDMMTQLFNSAVLSLSSPEFTENKNKELILQHMLIAPEMIFSHMNSPVTKPNLNLLKEIGILRGKVIAGSVTDKNLSDVISEISSLIGNSNTITTVVNDFTPLSFIFNKTYNQSLELASTAQGTENLSSKGRFVSKAIELILKDFSGNNKLKAVRYSDVKENEAYVTPYQINDNDIVLIPTDLNGNVLKFEDEDGTMRTPVLKIKNSESENNYALGILPGIIAKQKNIPVAEAREQARKALAEYTSLLLNINSALEKGEDYFLEIDATKSKNAEILSMNINEVVPISEIKNLDVLELTISMTKKSKRVNIIPEGGSTPVNISENALNKITQDQFEALLALIFFEGEIKVKTGDVFWKKASRKNIFKTIVRANLTGVIFSKNEKSITIAGSSFEINDTNKAEITTAFRNYVYEGVSIQYDKALNYLDITDIGSEQNATENNQVYVKDGVYYRKQFSLINFNQEETTTLDSNVTVLQSFKDGVFEMKKSKFKEHVIANGNVRIRMKNKELKSVPPYLSFKPSSFEKITEKTEEEVKEETILGSNNADTFFQSTSKKNQARVTEKQEKDAESWFENHPLSKLIRLHLTDEIHALGPQFVAEFVDNMITLYHGSDKTDIYHEAFHAFSMGVLSREQQKEMYDTLRTKPGYFTVTVYGKETSVSFSLATELQLEEYLAEEFKKFAVKGVTSQKGKVKEFFEKMLNLLKSFFGNSTFAEAIALNRTNGMTNALFSALYKGDLKSSSFDNRNLSAMYNSSEIKKINEDGTTQLEFSLEEVHLAMESMQSFLSNYIDSGVNSVAIVPEGQIPDRAQFMRVITLAGMDPIKQAAQYAALEKEIEQFKKDNLSIFNGYGTFRFKTHPVLLKNAFLFMKNSFVQQKVIAESKFLNDKTDLKSKFIFETVTKIIDNFGDFNNDNTYTTQDTYQDISSLFFNSYSGLQVTDTAEDSIDEQLAESDSGDNVRLIFDRSGNESAILDLADEHTKMLLSSVRSYGSNGKGVSNMNALNVQKLVPFKTMFAKVAKLLANTNDRQVMYARLVEAGKTDKELNQMLYKLGDPLSNATVSEVKQWISFWQTFNKADVMLRAQVIEKTTTIDQGGAFDKSSATTQSYSGDINKSYAFVINDWKDSFIGKMETGPYSSSDMIERDGVVTPGAAYFDLQKFILEFQPNLKVHDLTNGVGYVTILEYNSLSPDQKKLYSKNPTSTKSEADPVAFLRAVGIDLVNDPVVKDSFWYGDPSLELKASSFSYFSEFLEQRSIDQPESKYRSLDQLFKDYSVGSPPVKFQGKIGFLSTVAKLHQKYSNDNSSFMSRTAYGEMASEKSLNSSLTIEIQALNAAQSYDELLSIPGMEKFDFRSNPQIAANKWIVSMFNLDSPVTSSTHGVRNTGIKIYIENISGSKVVHTEITKNGENPQTTTVDKGVSSIGSDEKTKFITDVLLTDYGMQEIPRSEAKSSSLAVYASQTTESGSLIGGKTGKLAFDIETIDKVFSEDYDGVMLYGDFSGHIEAEIIRILRLKQVAQYIKDNPDEKHVYDFNFLERGQEWSSFSNIISDENKKALLKSYSDYLAKGNELQSFSINSAVSRALEKKIEKDLVSYFGKRSAELLKIKQDVEMPDNIMSKFEVKDENKKVNRNETMERLFRSHITNNFLQNMNYSSLFLGDPVLFNIGKEDYHKRNAGMISTGKIFVSDDAFLKFVNNQGLFNNRAFAKAHNKSKGIDLDYAYNGMLNTGVISESIHSAKYIDEMEELMGTEVASTYKNMEEADGQGWISFDSYRLLNISCDEWSEGQEDLYQKMLKGEKISSNKYKTTFPIKKFQYFGPVTTDKNLQPGSAFTAFHKYSLMPLIPALIKNKKLESLHNSMMEQGLDYVTMQSGSKLSTLSEVAYDKEADKLVKKSDVFYDENRKVNTGLEFVKNIISVKHLKNQVYLAEGFKGKVTLATQMRKMILHGIADNGVPTDYKGTLDWDSLDEKQKVKESKNYSWYKDYNSSMTQLREHFKQDILADLGMQFNNVTGEYEGNQENIIKFLQKELAKSDFLPHEIEAIVNSETGNLRDLSYSLNAEKLESILVTLVDNKLRKLKVNGEALVQASGTMYEDNDLEFDATNELKFYRKTLDGSPSFMEVKIALQGDFEKLFHLDYHTGGEKIAAYTKIEVDGKIKKELDYDESLKRLNESIKNPEWNKTNRSFITFAGVRIPTQGPNALDAVIVAEFLPKYAGTKVILPSEIVAKSGADYDIDKLFFMYPNFGFVNGKPEMIKYVGYDTNGTADAKQKVEEFELTVLKPLYEEIERLNDESAKKYDEQKDAFSSEEYSFLYNASREVFDQISDFKKTKGSVIVTGFFGGQKLNNTRVHEIVEILENQINSLYTQLEENNRKLEDLIFEATGSMKSELKEFFIKNKEAKKAVRLQIKLQKENKGAELERASLGYTTKGVENDILATMISKISSPENFVDLVTPNTTDRVLPIANDMEAKVKRDYNKYEKFEDTQTSNSVISGTSIFDYLYNLQKHQENSVAMEALGIAAVTSTFYATFTAFGGNLNPPSIDDLTKFNKADKKNKSLDIFHTFKSMTLKLSHNSVGEGDNKRITIGKRYSSDKAPALIADTISQLINGYLDVAKKAWIFNVQGNKENTPNLLFMVMAGVPVSDAIYLSSNPLVIEYNQIKKEMLGVYSNISNDPGTNPIIDSETSFKVNQLAQDELARRYSDLIKSSGYDNLSFSSINNLNETEVYTEKQLLDRVGEAPNSEDLRLLAQYLNIELITKDLTEFQQANKFDTKKIANITDAEQNKKQLESLFSKPSAIPLSWEKGFESTPIGLFKDKDFIINLFTRFFKIRNHEILNKKALSLKVKKGVFKNVMINAFKNDFSLFLYQNAMYSPVSYSTQLANGSPVVYKLTENKTQKEAIKVNEVNGEVTYNVNKLRHDMFLDRTINNLYKDGQMTEYVKYLIELRNVKESFVGVSEKEIREKHWFFDRYHIDAIPKLVAAYNTQSPSVMFDSNIGTSARFKALKERYADELSHYSLVEDLRSDTERKNDNSKKSNLYLQDTTDPRIMAVYLENLIDLSNNSNPDINSFFSLDNFSHISTMQAGSNTKSKYYLGKLDTKSRMETVIQKTFASERILKVFADIQKQMETESIKINKADGRLLDQYFNLFNDLTPMEYKQRSRGSDYTLNVPLAFVTTSTIKKTVMTEGDIFIYENLNDATKEDEFFVIVESGVFFDEMPGMTIDSLEELFKSWLGKKIAFQDDKIIPPSGPGINEKTFNALLLKYFGVDNSSTSPVLQSVPLFKIKDGLSIADAINKKKNNWVKDETMANNSNKAIAFPSKAAPEYLSGNKSSTRNYIRKIKEINSSAFDEQFVSSDAVWIFGAGNFKSSRGGETETSYQQILVADFTNKYAPVIDKAIKEGVSFNVGTANGIDKLAIDYLVKEGYKKIIRYAQIGKYYELVKSYDGKTSPLYSPKKGIRLSNGPFIELKKYLNDMNLFEGMDESDIASNGYDIVSDKINKKLEGDDKLRLNLINVLHVQDGTSSVLSKSGIDIGISISDSFLEQYLMKNTNSVLAQYIRNAQSSNGKTTYQGTSEKDNKSNYYWFSEFWRYVGLKTYQAFIRDLANSKSAEDIGIINNKIRTVYINELQNTFPELGKVELQSDNSTLKVENEQVLKIKEPTFERLMVGNHGIYIEFSTPKNTGNFVTARMQYNEYDRDGKKLYDQTKTVNYADYKPGKWYLDLYEAFGKKQPQYSENNKSNQTTTTKQSSAEREYTPENITSLKSNEVFVFGANTVGGHGGGTAGLAQRGTVTPEYKALPVGTKGKWSEYGIVDKLMQGTEGKSFGIVTKAASISNGFLKIGKTRSVPPSRIEQSINALILEANNNPGLKFLVTKFGTNMAGFTEQEMKSLLENKNLPENIVLPKEFEVRTANSTNSQSSNPVSTEATILLPIGISGSGKSTFIKTLSKDEYTVISPDEMRVEFTGNMDDKSKDKEIYEAVKERAIAALKSGKSVVIDSTNLQKDRRRDFISAINSASPNTKVEYKLLELNPALAKQRIKDQLARGENRANVPDTSIDRQALLYKEMLEDIKSENVSEFSETNSQSSEPVSTEATGTINVSALKQGTTKITYTLFNNYIKENQTKTGYKITIPEFPNVELYLTKEHYNSEGNVAALNWFIEVNTKGGVFTIYTEGASTQKQVLEKFADDINTKYSKSENGRKVLKSIGIELTNSQSSEPVSADLFAEYKSLGGTMSESYFNDLPLDRQQNMIKDKNNC